MSKFFILPLVLILGLGGAGCSSKNKEVQAETVDVQKSFKFTPQELEKIIHGNFKDISSWEPLERMNESTYRIIDKHHNNTDIRISANSKNEVTSIIVNIEVSQKDFDEHSSDFNRRSRNIFDTTVSILNPLNGYKYKELSPVKKALYKYLEDYPQGGFDYKEFHVERAFSQMKDGRLILFYEITPS